MFAKLGLGEIQRQARKTNLAVIATAGARCLLFLLHDRRNAGMSPSVFGRGTWGKGFGVLETFLPATRVGGSIRSGRLDPTLERQTTDTRDASSFIKLELLVQISHHVICIQ